MMRDIGFSKKQGNRSSPLAIRPIDWGMANRTNRPTLASAHFYASDYTGEMHVALRWFRRDGRSLFPARLDRMLTPAELSILSHGLSVPIAFHGSAIVVKVNVDGSVSR